MSDTFRKLGDVSADIVDGVAQKIRPIPTTYRGIAYRSRLEARWACFFALAGIAAEYEAEGYDLDGTWYLPDFWIAPWKLFIECKPVEPTAEEERKCQMLSTLSGNPVLLVISGPLACMGRLYIPEGGEFTGLATRAGLSHCRRCNAMLVAYAGADCWGWRLLEPCRAGGQCTDKWTPFGLGLEDAAQAAQNERFEGESRRARR